MEEKNVNTILEVLAQEIQKLKLDIYIKDAEIERLRKDNNRFAEGKRIEWQKEVR